jgi:hypothetical protein
MGKSVVEQVRDYVNVPVFWTLWLRIVADAESCTCMYMIIYKKVVLSKPTTKKYLG